jgi:uncharacterized protein
VSELRADLRARLTRARLDRDQAGAAALRSAIAALENAEAVPEVPGVVEADRRELSTDDERAILAGERADLLRAAEEYDAVGRPDAAADTRRAATLLPT